MAYDPQNIRILLVEDSAMMRTIQVRTLNKLGFNKVIEAEDGEVAVQKIEAGEGFELIISDWNMPNKDGLELLAWVRSHKQYKNTPFLMATGQGDLKQEQKAIDAGVSSFVAKPFDAAELKAKIDEAFGIIQDEEEIAKKKAAPRRTASGKVKLKVGHIQITDHLALGVLKHLIETGNVVPQYYQLETECMTGWNPVKQALERGTLDAACVLAPIAMDLFSVGIPIKLILLAHKSGSIFVRNSTGIYQEPFPEFFRHKSFLIPHQMSIHHMLAHMFFNRIGLKAGTIGKQAYDVIFEIVEPIKMPEFLRANPNSSGFLVAEPIGTKAIASGIAELQFLSHELWENHPCCVVAMRDDFISPYTDAVYEFTEQMVQAGRFIEKYPEEAAHIAVSFLDPHKVLGLKAPLIKHVITEPKGIKTSNLYPSVEDLDKIQRYMVQTMGVGTLIDLEKFIDIRFADAACKDQMTIHQVSKINDSEDVITEILKRGGEKTEKPTKPMPNPESSQNIKILLVEDSAMMRTIQVRTLNKLGFNKIVEAEDGVAAVRKMESGERFDLIISDWNMPNKDGLELLQWVRSHKQYKGTPFIMATGQGDLKQEQKAINAGVSSFVAKPFDASDLKNKIDEAFGITQDEEEIAKKKAAPRRTSSGKVKLKVAHIQITDHLVLGVLKHLIEKGDITPKYYQLETECMTGWNPVKQALERGTVDAACVLAPIAMDLFSVGNPIKLILLAHKSGSIFVRNSLGMYKEPFPDFFKNKSFFIPHQMSIHHMLAHMFFTRIGLKAGTVGKEAYDVTFEIVAPIKMPEFLRSNPDSSGFLVAEPIGTKAIASGIAELQFLSHELWENHPCCVVAMREDFINPYTDAVYEFTEQLVQAGKFIEKKPEVTAEIAVAFLDPNKVLGLKVPLLKNVIMESKGIKTTNLYPPIEDLDKIQRYMVQKMGVGTLIDLEKFIDIRFAEASCKDRITGNQVSKINDSSEVIIELLRRGVVEDVKTAKAMLNQEGKYLTFALGPQEFGIDILKIKEIIGMMPIYSVPQAPPCVKGVINLRGRVIPVVDLRSKFGMEQIQYTDRSCIIVLELEFNKQICYIGIAVDTVSEVLDVKASEIEQTPTFGAGIDTRHILAMAKIKDSVKILLDIDQILDIKKAEIMEAVL